MESSRHPFYVYAKRIGATVINVAHALTSNSNRCSIQSFDYYFLFGESSLNHLRNNPIRIDHQNLFRLEPSIFRSRMIEKIYQVRSCTFPTGLSEGTRS